MIQALHADSGCIQWVYNATGPVRAAMRVAPLGSGHVLLFGDQTGWFYAVSAETGKELWKKKIDDHDTARLDGDGRCERRDRLRSRWLRGKRRGRRIRITSAARSGAAWWRCGSRMAARCGSRGWLARRRNRGKTPAGKSKIGPSGASIWSAPTIDLKRKLMYVTTGDNFSLPATDTSDALVASLATGKIVWSNQVTESDVSPSERGPDFDFGSRAMMVKTPEGKDLIVAGQKSGIVYGFDPDKKGNWCGRCGSGKGGSNGGVQWGTASDGRYVFAATSDKVSTRTTGPDGQMVRTFDKTKGGGLTALRIADGSQVWFAKPDDCTAAAGCSPAQSAALTAIPGVVFSGSYDGPFAGLFR